jgi:hypothetical protein
MPVGTFTHTAGEQHLYQFSPLKGPDPGTPGAVTAPATYSISDATIGALTTNTAVANDLQLFVNYLAVGTATITATGINELAAAFMTEFEIIAVAPPPPVVTDRFAVSELS